MWQVKNVTPFGAAGSWVRDRDGAEIWLVAVRCTFRIAPDGTASVADEQEPPIEGPVYRGDPATSSVLYDSDFYLTKPTTDVLLHGHAYAPGGRPAAQVDVTMRVGQVSKTLRVVGDRNYERGLLGLSPGPAEPFARMPLVYERTFGGREPMPLANPDRPQYETQNPVGAGFVRMAGQRLPNIESANGPSGPAGFGPIAPHWHPRVRHAGTYDEAWQTERCPLYPADLDDRFFLSSPEDQRPASFLRGGEIVDLRNLTPSGRLTFALPRVAFDFATEFSGSPRVHHRGRLHTVILEPDVPRVILVCRTELSCHSRVTKLQRTVVRQKTMTNGRGDPAWSEWRREQGIDQRERNV